ncbi:MAG TPA: hypothetical protein VJR89_15160 [Polyangiales bacterium]|nr:hypothetical protein [Polyangiales bacterium]
MTHAIAISCAQAVIGVLSLGGIWLGLPARWWPVDVFGSLLGAAALSAAALVHGRAPFARRWTRGVVWAELIAGTLTVTLLCCSLAQLVGSYGPVGGGGALLMATIAALILPYLVGLPALQLHWLRER